MLTRRSSEARVALNCMSGSGFSPISSVRSLTPGGNSRYRIGLSACLRTWFPLYTYLNYHLLEVFHWISIEKDLNFNCVFCLGVNDSGFKLYIRKSHSIYPIKRSIYEIGNDRKSNASYANYYS